MKSTTMAAVLALFLGGIMISTFGCSEKVTEEDISAVPTMSISQIGRMSSGSLSYEESDKDILLAITDADGKRDAYILKHEGMNREDAIEILENTMRSVNR